MSEHVSFVPPHSIEAEQSVLGGLLLDNQAWDRFDGSLDARDFYLSEHQRIFHVLALLLDCDKPADVITVSNSLAGSDAQERGKTLSYLHELAHNTPSAANIGRYVEIVRNLKVRRNVLELSHRVAHLAVESSDDELLDRVTSLVMGIAADGGCAGEPQTIGALLPGLMDMVDERHRQKSGVLGLTTGFSELDRLTCGLQSGDLIIVAGRPSMGKTTLAVNVAENASLNGGVALVVSLEMSKAQLAERSLARFSGVNTQSLRNGKLSADDFSKMTTGLKTLQNSHLIIADDPSLSNVGQIRLAARKTKQRMKKLDLIVIDYLQLMQGRGNTRNDELSGITRSLKLLAKELDCPIVLLSQLSREVEKRTDKRPLLSDLRESGAIEQDADVVIMLYRDDYYNDQSPLEGYAQLLVRKQRMGPIGDLYLKFQGQYSRLLDADEPQVVMLQDAMTRQTTRQHRKFG
ncbi:replicative DNA helicase [Oligella ureolytica]